MPPSCAPSRFMLSFLYPYPTQCLQRVPRPKSALRPRPQPHHLHQRRSFTNTQPSSAVGRAGQGMSTNQFVMTPNKQPARPSMKTQLQEAKKDMSKSSMDMGMMPEIFIKPTSGRQLPRWFLFKRKTGNWSFEWPRMRLEWHSFKSRAKALGAIIYFYKFASRPRLPLGWSARVTECEELHREMYTALAAGDLPTLRLICAEGLYRSSAAQIQNRTHASSPPLMWEIVKYTGKVRVVFDLAAQMEIKGHGIRQCVVRIPSEQRILEKLGTDENGLPVPGKVVKEMETTEYMVMQKRIVEGKEGEWVIWGTVKENRLEDVGKPIRPLPAIDIPN